MRGFMKRGAVALAGCAAFLTMAAGSASGAVVVGSNLAATPNNGGCLAPMGAWSCTFALSGLPGPSLAPGGARVGTDGVIVGWSVRSGAAAVPIAMRLRVVRGGNLGAGSGAIETLPAGVAGVHSFGARLPVKAADQIGLDALNVPNPYAIPVLRTGVPGATTDFWVASPLADGEARAPTADDYAAAELLMNVTIEPDRDGDGYGDETQDVCPDAATAAVPPCPQAPQPKPQAPQTRIKKGPKGKVSTRSATFRFTSTVTGSTFQCKLDRKPFKACKSPKTYRGLADGKHTFRVRAVGPGGLIDPTPAKRTFRVKS